MSRVVDYVDTHSGRALHLHRLEHQHQDLSAQLAVVPPVSQPLQNAGTLGSANGSLFCRSSDYVHCQWQMAVVIRASPSVFSFFTLENSPAEIRLLARDI